MPVMVPGGAGGLYFNTGTTGTPVWVEQTAVKDVSPKFPWKFADAPSRAAAINLSVKTLVDAEVGVTMRADPLDAMYAAWVALCNSRITNMDTLVLNGKISVLGACGIRANMLFSQDEEPEEIDGAVISTFKLKPTLGNNSGANIFPQWALVSTGPAAVYTPILFTT